MGSRGKGKGKEDAGKEGGSRGKGKGKEDAGKEGGFSRGQGASKGAAKGGGGGPKGKGKEGKGGFEKKPKGFFAPGFKDPPSDFELWGVDGIGYTGSG